MRRSCSRIVGACMYGWCSDVSYVSTDRPTPCFQSRGCEQSYGVYVPTVHTKHPMVGDGWVAYCTYVPPPRHHAYHFYHLNKIISHPFIVSQTYRTLIATVTKVHKSRPQYAQYAPRNPACGVAGKRADGYERVLLRRVRRGLSRLGEGVAW